MQILSQKSYIYDYWKVIYITFDFLGFLGSKNPKVIYITIYITFEKLYIYITFELYI